MTAPLDIGVPSALVTRQGRGRRVHWSEEENASLILAMESQQGGKVDWEQVSKVVGRSVNAVAAQWNTTWGYQHGGKERKDSSAKKQLEKDSKATRKNRLEKGEESSESFDPDPLFAPRTDILTSCMQRRYECLLVDLTFSPRRSHHLPFGQRPTRISIGQQIRTTFSALLCQDLVPKFTKRPPSSVD